MTVNAANAPTRAGSQSLIPPAVTGTSPVADGVTAPVPTVVPVPTGTAAVGLNVRVVRFDSPCDVGPPSAESAELVFVGPAEESAIVAATCPVELRLADVGSALVFVGPAEESAIVAGTCPVELRLADVEPAVVFVRPVEDAASVAVSCPVELRVTEVGIALVFVSPVEDRAMVAGSWSVGSTVAETALRLVAVLFKGMLVVLPAVTGRPRVGDVAGPRPAVAVV